jgi:hypothetical protein
MRACLQELRKRLEENHGKCAESLTKKAAADAQAASEVSAHTPNVMQVMMLFQKAQHRAKAAQYRAKAGSAKGKTLDTVAKTLPLTKPCVWGCVHPRAQWSTEEDTHRRPGITGCVSLVIQVMTQVVRRSSISRIGSGRITGAPASTQENVVLSSNGGSTEWRRMSQDSRSKSVRRTLTHHGHLWLC